MAIKEIIKKARKGQYLLTVFALILGLAAPLLFEGGTVSADAAEQVENVSTGPSSACAIMNHWAYCWGSNQYGQLGTGSNSSQTTPVAVASNKDAIPAGPDVCSGWAWFQTCQPSTPAKPASAMANLYVEKVSVGATHACALANARVFCWGDNSHGQLGNRTNSSSNTPVAVDIQFKDITPAPVAPKPCGGWFQPSCKPVAQPTKPKSALGAKEVIDIAAGEYFSCALASDGSVACWGEGANGRLGNNKTSDYNYPQAVYAQGSLGNRRGVKLAEVSGAAMCVLTISSNSNPDNTEGTPYCWGYGMGDGSIPGKKTTSSSSTVNKSSCTSNTSTGTSTAYFDSLKPVAYSGVLFASVDTDGEAMGLSANGDLYHWGLNGYKGTRVTKTTCGGSAGGNGLSTSGKKCGGGGNHGSPGCAAKVTKRTTTTTTYSRIGLQSAEPLGYSSGPFGSSIRTASGSSTGLLCGVVGSGTYCDARGSGMSQGQTGSGYTQHCTTKVVLFFSQTTCDPAPSGPQKVATNKNIDYLSVSPTGYACAIADGSLGCWGVNNHGQLGVGNTSNRNVPTTVSF